MSALTPGRSDAGNLSELVGCAGLSEPNAGLGGLEVAGRA